MYETPRYLGSLFLGINGVTRLRMLLVLAAFAGMVKLRVLQFWQPKITQTAFTCHLLHNWKTNMSHSLMPECKVVAV
jgi:hypothetical protein